MGLGRILFLVFMLVPLIEIAFFVLIGNAIGLWPTLAGVLITAVVGSLVLRYQGMAVFNDMRAQMNRGQVPA
ncbi:MAG TPA: FxsA family protein, partial [Devosia sp.]